MFSDIVQKKTIWFKDEEKTLNDVNQILFSEAVPQITRCLEMVQASNSMINSNKKTLKAVMEKGIQLLCVKLAPCMYST